MSKKRLALALLLAIALLGLVLRPLWAGLPVVTPQEAGLVYQECAQEAEFGGWQQAPACFGHEAPDWDEAETARRGKRTNMQDLALVIGEDTYTARFVASLLLDWFVLSKNGWPQRGLLGEFTAFSPNIGLAEIGGKAAWEFADHDSATIVYDGRDLRREYGLRQAYRPYALGDKLIFIGQKGGKYFVVYDGRRLTPEFDDVLIAYCCEVAMYAPQGRGEYYLFNGVRDGQNYLVEISLAR